jgi:arylsulfatase A-like enzyme
VASILTGREPIHHGLRYLNGKLADSETTLAEVLAARGYDTISVAATGFVFGSLAQGFRVTEGTGGEWAAKETTDRALAALAKAPSRPVFLFVFYRDPHMPYAPPTRAFDPEYRGRFRDGIDFAPSKGEMVYRNTMTPREREHAVALYDDEIRTLDGELARLLAAVEARRRRPVVVLTADHGEDFGERGVYFDHGDVLGDAALRVPLIVTGIPFGTPRVDRLVRLVDIMPTVLARLGIKVPGVAFDGVDLAKYAKDSAARLDAFAETGDCLLREAFETGHRAIDGIRGRPRALTSGNRRAILVPRPAGATFELYDLARDPLQRTNLYPRADAETMFRRLAERVAADRQEDAPPALAPEDVERLKALGYL